jgi:hypothetical protein
MWRGTSAFRLGRDAAILRVNDLAERQSKRAPRNKFYAAAGKYVSGSSGVKTPEESAASMSCLKARPTKLLTTHKSCDLIGDL